MSDVVQDRYIQRFHTKVRKESGGCWMWTAGVRSNGYGAYWYGGRVEGAHRAAWLMFVGPIPEDQMVVQFCMQKLCCNPDHLELKPNPIGRAA